jgi:peptide chain release factor 3
VTHFTHIAKKRNLSNHLRRSAAIVRAQRQRRVTEPVRHNDLDDPKLPWLLPKRALARLREEVEVAKGLCPTFDLEAYRDGHLTPVYFGNAVGRVPNAY